jgi:hypothetical protein
MCRPLCFLLLALLSSTATVHSIPKIVCGQTIHEFGTIDASTPATHTFTIHNEGDSELIIKKIHAPCGCTTFRLENKTLAPGSSLEIPVTLSLAGRKGPQQKSLYLETNDPATPTLQLTMRGNAGSDIEITPPVLVLRHDPKTGAIAGEVRVVHPAGHPLECLEAKSLEGKTDLSTTPLSEGKGFTLRATAATSLTPGQHHEKIQLRLRGTAESEKTIDALILRPVEFLAAPSVLRLDATAAAPLSRTIMVTSPNGNAFTIDSVDVPDPRITVKTEAVGKNRSRIVVANITPDPSLDAKPLRIHIGGPEPRILEVPLAISR